MKRSLKTIHKNKTLRENQIFFVKFNPPIWKNRSQFSIRHNLLHPCDYRTDSL